MASKTDVRLVCDMEHESETPAVTRAVLAFNNRVRQLDLCQTHADEVVPYVQAVLDHGTPVGQRKPKREPGPRTEAQRVRKWGEEQGLIEPGARGRVPQAVWQAYEQAN